MLKNPSSDVAEVTRLRISKEQAGQTLQNSRPCLGWAGARTFQSAATHVILSLTPRRYMTRLAGSKVGADWKVRAPEDSLPARKRSQARFAIGFWGSFSSSVLSDLRGIYPATPLQNSASFRSVYLIYVESRHRRLAERRQVHPV